MGFTAEEVKGLCEEYQIDFEECKNWYDGYRLDGIEIYNPESVVLSIRKEEFDSYWSQTSSYIAIAERLAYNFRGIKDAVIQMLSGREVSPSMPLPFRMNL